MNRTIKDEIAKDEKGKVKKADITGGQHCIYRLTHHMIFVTHYRKPIWHWGQALENRVSYYTFIVNSIVTGS